jgi:transposase
MSLLSLTPRQRSRLLAQLRRTRDARVYRRTLALLQLDAGFPVAHVARLHAVDRRSIYHWIGRYAQSHDPRALVNREGSGRPTVWSEDLEALLRNILRADPQQLGFPDSTWSVPLLARVLSLSGHPMSPSTIRRELFRLGVVWKRARYALRPDPELEKKTASAAASEGPEGQTLAPPTCGSSRPCVRDEAFEGNPCRWS